MRSICIFFAAVLLAGPVLAADTLERVRDSGTFTIGYRSDAQPYSYRTAEGEAAGYIVDLCREVAEAVQQELDLAELETAYVQVTAENRFDAVTSGQVDLLCDPTSITLDRRAKVDFSLATFVDGASVLYRADGPRSFEALKGQKVGVRGGTTTEQVLRAALSRMNIDAEIVPLADHKDGIRQLRDGTIAAYFADRAILIFMLFGDPEAAKGLQLSDQFFTHETYGLALPRGDDAFRLVVDATLARLYRTGEILPIFVRNFGESAVPSDLLKAMFVINALPE